MFNHSVMFNSLRLHAVALQAALSLGLFKHEYWSGLPFPSPGGFSDLGIKPESPVAPMLAGRFLTAEPVPPQKDHTPPSMRLYMLENSPRQKPSIIPNFSY